MLVDDDCMLADLLFVLVTLMLKIMDALVNLCKMILDFVLESVMILICYFSHLPFATRRPQQMSLPQLRLISILSDVRGFLCFDIAK